MAHKKGMGSTKNGRDSESKRLGVKAFGGQFVQPGSIIIRQRGTKFHPGRGVGIGKDHTIYSKVEGQVVFRRRKNGRSFISVLPEGVTTSPNAPPSPKATKKTKTASAKEAESQEQQTETEAQQSTQVETQSEAKDGDAQNALLKALGEASESNKDDLKEINGVGPSMEEKLNAIGIYKFEQVGKVGESELELIGQLDSSLPGRIKQEWIAQAQSLSNG